MPYFRRRYLRACGWRWESINLVEEFHANDHLKVIHRHDGEVEFSILRSERYTNASNGARDGLAGKFITFIVFLPWLP